MIVPTILQKTLGKKMNHLTKNDLILFATKRQVLSENMEVKNQHVLACPDCKTQLNEISKVLSSFSIENEKQCHKYSNFLLKYLEKVEQPELTPELQKHFDDCEICKRIYQVISILSPIDQARSLKLNIPQHIIKQLDMKVYAELEKFDVSPYLVQIKDKVQGAVKNKIRVLEFFLMPAPALSGTRGNDESNYFIFTHNGGKIQLQIGLANKDIKLFGIFEDQVFSDTTDTKGNIFFENLPKDDYRVEVKGYNVSNIKIVL